MTKKYIVFTSEYGSGARLIGKFIAEQLGIKFYGEEDLLVKASKESGIDEKILREYDAKLASTKLNESVRLDGELLKDELSAKIYNAYSSTILKIVEEGPCILMERGADIVLKGKIDFLNVYAYTSSIEKKIERCIKIGGFSEEDAPKVVVIEDMKRKLYYNSFSNIERGNMSEYDLCINTDTFTGDTLAMGKCSEIIKAAL